jgi:hypothetical protein
MSISVGLSHNAVCPVPLHDGTYVAAWTHQRIGVLRLLMLQNEYGKHHGQMEGEDSAGSGDEDGDGAQIF